MQATERRVLPRDLSHQLVLPVRRAGLEAQACGPVQTLRARAVPGFDQCEVVELRHARRRRREPPRGGASILGELVAVECVAPHQPGVCELPGKKRLSEVAESRGVVELVAVDAQHPDVLACVSLDQLV